MSARELVLQLELELGVSDGFHRVGELGDDRVLGPDIEVELGQLRLDLGQERALGVLLDQQLIAFGRQLVLFTGSLTPGPFIERLVGEGCLRVLFDHALEKCRRGAPVLDAGVGEPCVVEHQVDAGVVLVLVTDILQVLGGLGEVLGIYHGNTLLQGRVGGE